MAASVQFATVEELALHQLTIEYGKQLIQNRQQQGPPLEEIPAWTPFRTYLAEALDYIVPGCPSECIADGAVVACIIGPHSGERTYLDSEVAIFQICTSIDPDLSPRAYSERREAIVKAWVRTWKTGASLVLVQAPDFNSRTIDTTGRNYVVLDHFRVALIWPEEDAEGVLRYMARLEKCDLDSKSWWTPSQPDPPARREYLDQTGAPLTDPCPDCRKQSPWVYNEAPLCFDRHCSSFCTDISRTSSAAMSPPLTELTFADSFLLYRAHFDSHPLPSFPLTRDIMTDVMSLVTSPPLISSELLLRGIICPQCNNIVPKAYWHLWHCDACPPDVQTDYACPDGASSFAAVVLRHFVSDDGYPDLQFNVPPGISHHTLPRMFKDHDADFGHLKLHRYRDSEPPALANYFQSTWGAEYGFHGFQASTPAEHAPWSVSAAQLLLDHVATTELGTYVFSNSVQTFGFLQGQGLDWHTDGEGELGDTIAILNLGGDAVFKIPLVHGSIVLLHGSLFSKYYEHSLETRDPLTFQVVTRTIDEQKHNDLLRTRHTSRHLPRRQQPRPNGLLFTVVDAAVDVAPRPATTLHDSGMSYMAIRHADPAHLGRWTVTALSTAYKRIQHKCRTHRTHRTHRHRHRRHGEPASLASNSGQPWSQEELDQLWELRRERVPPVAYAEIERINGSRRTEKAYREQME
ncbi:hypothetical protein DV735_g5596, partial [Chaetothyriales sp. CBS 134920]